MKHLKKITVLLLLLSLFLVSCQGNKPEDTDTTVTDVTSETEAVTEAPPAPKTTMKVMSLNVWGGDSSTTTVDGSNKTVDGTIETRSEKLNALLNGENIDIAGLQEMRLDWKTWMRKSMDEKYAFVGKSTRETGEGGYVIYLKDKYTVKDSGVFWLVEGAPTSSAKDPNSNFDRMCTWVIFQVIETGEYFLFMDTHLDTVDSVRAGQATVLVGQIPVLQQTVKENYGVDNCPVILVGDMNSEIDTEPYNIMSKALCDSRVYSKGATIARDYSTSPGFWYCETESDVKRNGHYIDYIFVSKSITVKNHKMIHTATNLCLYGEYISDHNAMIAEIQLP